MSPRREPLLLRLIATSICLTGLAFADPAPARAPEERKDTRKEEPKTPGLLDRITVSVYGSLLPFVEHVSSSGATPFGFTGGASQVVPEEYSGFNERPRMRMTAGTSNLGFRGTLRLFDQLKVTWQVESAVPIDGNGPPNTIASRNSHIGLTGDWGTLIFGQWDTPWKWATLVTINPIRGGYVSDYTSILSTPGFGVSALNTTSVFLGSISNAAFYRREPNSIQYWSPTVFGFSARLNYTINEARPSRRDVLSGPVPNPYLISGYVGFDGAGLRVRYAYELHKDYFGMSQLGGTRASAEATASTDQGHTGLIQYAHSWTPRVRTRLVGTAELLSYRTKDTTPGAINEHSRPAFYALLEQSLFGHRVWGAYGQAFAGTCRRVGGGPCTTQGLQARLASLGYMFEFSDDFNAHVIGYRVYNDVSSRHSTYIPPFESAPGADLTGIGLGVFYSFDVGLAP